MNDYFKTAVRLLKTIYQEDITAISQILVAEAENDTEIILSYLDCVEEFVAQIKEKIKKNK